MQLQFAEYANATKDYYQSISEMQHIISDISSASESFVNIVMNIQTQIQEVSDMPDGKTVNSQDVLEKARQTEETTEAMTALVNRNNDNAAAISGIVNRFS